MTSIKNRFKLFDVWIDPLDMDETVQLLRGWIMAAERACKYVVTPNVDHIVILDKNQEFKKAYQASSLTVIDGNPVKMAAQIFGHHVPCTVRGSDLTPAIFECFNRNAEVVKVFLLGAPPNVAERAAQTIRQTWPYVDVVGTLSPAFGFEKNSVESDKICEEVNASGADLLVIGLGAPKQELWIYQYQTQLSVKVALCVGATIDFMAGEKNRAPLWMREAYLEWLHRALSEPKRLGKRYAKDAIVFPMLFFKEWRSRL